jgi:hypothetical protein
MRKERCEGVLDQYADRADIGAHSALSCAPIILADLDLDFVEARGGVNKDSNDT